MSTPFITWTPQDESLIPAAAKRLFEAIHALNPRWKAIEGLRIEASARGGSWIPEPILKIRREDGAVFSAHESIEAGFLMEACAEALVAFASFLNPKPCSAMGLRLRVPLHEGSWTKIRPLAETWSDFRCPPIPLDLAAATLPNAQDLLTAFGGVPFLALPRGAEDLLATSVRERPSPSKAHFAADLSLDVLSPRVSEEEAAENALRQAAFLAVLREGDVHMETLGVEGFRILPARQAGLVSEARTRVEEAVEAARRLHRARAPSVGGAAST